MSQRKHLTPSEVERLLDAALLGNNPERDYCLIRMCFMHGCRVSEINSWKISDIDLHGNNIYVHRLKNGFSTIHPLFEMEVSSLKKWLSVRRTYRNAESNWLFLSQKGNPLSRQRIYKLMRQFSVVAGLDINAHPHMLRHACGFALADRGVDTRLIQDYLGHRNIQHTVLYTATNARRFKEVWS